MTRRRVAATAAMVAMLATACAPAVPDLRGPLGDSAAAATTDLTTTTSSSAAPESSTTAASPTTTTTTTSTSTTTTTIVPEGPVEVTVGAWSLAPVERDESGEQFSATITQPKLTGNVDAALQARVDSIVEGHVESQVGATLALWRSIEDQDDRDLTGSTLTLEYEVAGFVESLVSLRFFSEEQVSGSSSAKRQATTLMIDLVSGVAVGLDDVVVDGDGRAQLLPLVQDGLLVDYFEGDEDAFSLWAGNLTAADLDDSALSEQGLEIWFDELEVGPPAIGMPVVLIGYDALVGILDPAGPAQAFTDL